MKQKYYLFYVFILSFLMFMSNISLTVIAAPISNYDNIGSFNDNVTEPITERPQLKMEIYDYIPPIDSSDPNDLGVIGNNKLEDNQRLLLPGHSYMVKIVLSSSDNQFSFGSSSLDTEIEFDSSKLEFTSNSHSGTKTDKMMHEKDKKIFDSGLGNGSNSVTSWHNGYYDTIINTYQIGTTNDARVSILQSRKDGSYTEPEKLFKGPQSGDNVIAALTFKVIETAEYTSTSDFLRFSSESQEIDVFNDSNTTSRMLYNNISQTNYSKFINVNLHQKIVNEPQQFTLKLGNHSEGQTSNLEDLYIYYNKNFRDTGFSLIDNGYDYSRYYYSNISREVNSNGNLISLPSYSPEESITGLSANPNSTSIITYTLSYKNPSKSGKILNRNLNILYLIGDVDNNSVIDQNDLDLYYKYIDRKIKLKDMIGLNETEQTYKLRALDTDRDQMISTHDRVLIANEVQNIAYIKQLHSYLVN